MINSIRCLAHRQGSMRTLRSASQRYMSAATPAAATHLNGYVPCILPRNHICISLFYAIVDRTKSQFSEPFYCAFDVKHFLLQFI
jgi:hypothetical protein